MKGNEEINQTKKNLKLFPDKSKLLSFHLKSFKFQSEPISNFVFFIQIYFKTLTKTIRITNIKDKKGAAGLYREEKNFSLHDLGVFRV